MLRSDGDKMKKVVLIILTVFFLGIIGLIVSIPIVNNIISDNVAADVKSTPLPEGTEYIEKFSKAGKVVGNGNGMQYLGGILIKSDLPLESIQKYYQQYTDKDYEYIVEKQSGNNISVIEHGNQKLKSDVEGDNYYIVYAWGGYYGLWSEFDIRGQGAF